MFLVDLPSPGVRLVRTPAYTHTISHHHPIVASEDVRVPAANLVGAEGDEMTYARQWFRFERLVAGMLADSLTELFAARCLLDETARGIDRGAAACRGRSPGGAARSR